MNNDSTPTDLPRTDTSANTTGDSVEPAQQAQTRRRDVTSPAQKRVLLGMRKRHEFVANLMTNLDILIYAELSIVYYMDCSLFRLLLRVFNQMLFLTPKPNFIPPAPQHRPYIGAIFGPNIICILLHIFTARSEAGEAMRGYLHGGVIIDLIGQKGPTSKIHLVLLDLLILGLQCFMLAVHVERERLTKYVAALSSGSALPPSDQPRAEVATAQDHDAEEQGIMRDGITGNEGVELEPLPPQNGAPTTSATVEADAERNEERERLLAEPPPRTEEEEEDDTGLDIFWSGTAVLANFHIVQNLRRQWQDYGNATESALQTVGYSAGFSAEFTALAANRRLNAAGARFQRQVGGFG
ncbi:DUF1746-domain-containing protein [Mollisia scopiformis]|uniref:DUF1746-domain-containing protein n=1 Tax=Mollisia scopiformis TaxID=149040 RepID=A0A194XV01_MOLSC|nr:DUF1746-domain-containing protein [Mollisia scopiformis]KUJ24038.1 DUF1746-domain-containing protein [Mollisia scopiformis]